MAKTLEQLREENAALREQNKKLAKQLKEQQERTAEARRSFEEFEREMQRKLDRAEQQRRVEREAHEAKVRRLEAAIKREEDAVKEIDRELARQDREADRTTGPRAPLTQIGAAAGVTIDASGQPTFIKPLTTDQLGAMDTKSAVGIAQMNEYLNVVGLSDPVLMRHAQRKYLERFQIEPGDPRYDVEMERLAENSSRFVLAEARRIAERQQTLRDIGGNLNQNVVRIAEGDDPCDECLPLNGEEGPYIDFVVHNKRPGDRCLGGNNCLCIMVAVN
jgi:uncharacterized protein with GYD domain